MDPLRRMTKITTNPCNVLGVVYNWQSSGQSYKPMIIDAKWAIFYVVKTTLRDQYYKTIFAIIELL